MEFSGTWTVPDRAASCKLAQSAVIRIGTFQNYQRSVRLFIVDHSRMGNVAERSGFKFVGIAVGWILKPGKQNIAHVGGAVRNIVSLAVQLIGYSRSAVEAEEYLRSRAVDVSIIRIFCFIIFITP